jgi:hypothetical protein
VIVWGCITAIIGLLNLYTDSDSLYTWRRSSEIIAKIQGHGTNQAHCIHEWAMGFLRWRDLPLYQLNWKHWTIIDDEDIAEEMRGRMMEKANGGFLKAEDVVDIVASPGMQAIFACKGITKATISVRMGLCWLERLGWTYGKLSNGMYLDGHEREDVVDYRKAFVEQWMGYE